MRPAHRYLLEIDNGNPSPDALAWAAASIRKWWRRGGEVAFHRCADIVTIQKARDAIRNDLLRRAAEHIDGGITHKAETLAKHCADMEARLWGLWRDEQDAPERAGPALTLLFQAKRQGSTLPCSVRQVFDIITSDAESGA